MDEIWDCVVVGGGAAGLSAALVLGRARRRTLVVDAGAPSNLVAHGIGGLLGFDQRPPADLYAHGRLELATYPSVDVRTGEVVGGALVGSGAVLHLGDGSEVRTRRVLLATGMDYQHPELPGLAERWGRSVFHCPFCHGWEVRDLPLAVLGGTGHDGERALLLRNWSDDVVLLTDGSAPPDGELAERLAERRISVDRRRVVGVADGPDGSDLVSFAEGPDIIVGGMLVPVVLAQRSDLASQLGVDLRPAGPIAVDPVVVDAFGQTSQGAVAAAGDAAAEVPSITAAIAAGSAAAAGVVRSLVLSPEG